MAEKQTLVGSVRAKIWAGVMSGVAAVAGSSTMYFWNTLTGQIAQKAAPEEKQRDSSSGKFSRQQFFAQPTMYHPAKFRQQGGKYCALLGCRLDEEQGVLQVVDVPADSRAAELGCLPGDIIESINKRPVQSALEIGMAASRVSRLLSSEMVVRRGHSRLEADFRLRADNTILVRTALQPVNEPETPDWRPAREKPVNRRF